MKRSEFEKLVQEGFEQLPDWVRQKIKNVALLIEDEPSEDVRKSEGLAKDETLLGLYHGIPLSERGENYGVGPTMPDTITLYQKPIEEAALEDIRVYETTNFTGDVERAKCESKAFAFPSRGVQKPSRFTDAVKKVVAETIWHEFAHHFGMDEGEVRAREEKRGR